MAHQDFPRLGEYTHVPDLAIAHVLDVAETGSDAGWIVPSRYAKRVTEVLIDAARNPGNRAHLTSDENYADLISHVIGLSELKIPAERVVKAAKAITPLLKALG